MTDQPRWARPRTGIGRGIALVVVAAALWWAWWARSGVADVRSPPWRGWLFGAHAPLLNLAGLAAVAAVSTVRPRRPLQVREHRGVRSFVAPGPYLWAAFYCCLYLSMAARYARTPMRGTDDRALLALLVGLVVLTALPIIANRPRMELTPDGINVVNAFGRWWVPWRAVAVGPRLVPPGSPDLLTVDRTDQVTRHGLTWRRRRSIALPLVDLNRSYRANIINYYLDRPDERALIGTIDGYTRLQAWARLPPNRYPSAAVDATRVDATAQTHEAS